MRIFVLDILNFYLLNSISLDEVLKEEKKYYHALHTFWKESNYLTPRWWLLVILSVLPPIIWWKFVDKKNITETTLFGLFFGVAAIILDSIGSNAMFWIYPVRLTPYLNPQFYPYDVGIVIIPFMLVYQHCRNEFKKFILYAGCLSTFLAFLAEPFMEYLQIYKEFAWKNIYSFFIYWILSNICWLVSKGFKKLEQKQ
ncbi:MAG: CBO0543 family protein [Bacillota bacterium]|nr:CBO0543 family protein [Bacillota bacterium]